MWLWNLCEANSLLAVVSLLTDRYDSSVGLFI